MSSPKQKCQQQTLVEKFVQNSYVAHNAAEDVTSLKQLYEIKLGPSITCDDLHAISYHHCMDSFSDIVKQNIYDQQCVYQTLKGGHFISTS